MPPDGDRKEFCEVFGGNKRTKVERLRYVRPDRVLPDKPPARRRQRDTMARPVAV